MNIRSMGRDTRRAAATACLILAATAGALTHADPAPAVGSIAIASGRAGSSASRPPNVLLILTDDQRWDAISPEMMPVTTAQLAGKGVTFDNMFVVNSWCCPSRTSILTGNYSHTTGVYTIAGKYGANAFDPSSTVATWLKGAGYRTGLSGKYLNGFTGKSMPPGWSDFFGFLSIDYTKPLAGYYNYKADDNGTIRSFGTAPADYATGVITQRTLDFISSTPTDQPFFAYMATTAPHGLPVAEDKYKSTPPRDVATPPNFCEADVSDKPAFIRASPVCGSGASFSSKVSQQDRTLQSVDDGVGRVLALLEARGQIDNTIVIFTSDNGLLDHEHRRTGKELPYEESIRVPLVIRFDKLGPVATNRHELGLATNIDLADTIAELTGVPTGSQTEGVSLVPALLGSGPVRRDLLVEHLRSGVTDLGGPTFCAVRTNTAKLVEYSTGEHELYDLTIDPYELENIAGRRPALEAALHRRLLQLCQPRPPGLTLTPP